MINKPAFICVIVVSSFVLSLNSHASGDDIELAHLMSQAQTFLHKAGLSIEAKNQKLTDFYLHELEESLERIEEVKSYDGYPIGELTKSMLMPAFERLEQQSKKDDLKSAKQAYIKLIESCNACHQATKHGFIRIEHNTANPYLQRFD